MQGAFYHKPTKTLMVTEAVQYVPREAPEVQCSFYLRYQSADPALGSSYAWSARGCQPLLYVIQRHAGVCGTSGLSLPMVQVVNRAKLLRAGKDNTFVRLVRLAASPHILPVFVTYVSGQTMSSACAVYWCVLKMSKQCRKCSGSVTVLQLAAVTTVSALRLWALLGRRTNACVHLSSAV